MESWTPVPKKVGHVSREQDSPGIVLFVPALICNDLRSLIGWHAHCYINSMNATLNHEDFKIGMNIVQTALKTRVAASTVTDVTHYYIVAVSPDHGAFRIYPHGYQAWEPATLLYSPEFI